MPRVQRFFTASTRDIADQCIEDGLLAYPGVCYLEDEKSLLWIKEDNSVNEIIGHNQITDITFEDGYILFHGVEKILYSIQITFSDDVMNHVKDDVIQAIHLDDYIKTDDAIKLLHDTIGDLGDSTSVVEYISNLTYNDLKDNPIETLVGTMIKAINLSEQNDGIYKLVGQYIIGGENTTINIGKQGDLCLIDSDEDNIYIKLLNARLDKLYTISKSDGVIETNENATVQWVKNYVSDSNFEQLINDNISGIDDEKIKRLF